MKRLVIALLTLETRLALWRHRPFIVGVTGSVGKTSTKDLIGAVLAGEEGEKRVRKSKKSMNSDIGLPLTVLGLENAWGSPLHWAKNLLLGALVPFSTAYPKILVLEIGADQPNDIVRLLGWLKTDMVVVTRLPDVPVHLENYRDPESVREEEWALTHSVKEGGYILISGDDAHAMAKAKGIERRTIVSYGLGATSAVRAGNIHVDYGERNDRIVPYGMGYTIEWKGRSTSVSIEGVLGEQAIIAALAASAVGLALGYDLERISRHIEGADLPPGRMRLLAGVNDTTLIDDSYNASPIAMEAALRALKEAKNEGRKVALLGDMLELGTFSEAQHRKIGTIAGEFLDLLVVVGKRAKWIADEAKKQGMIAEAVYEFASSKEAGHWMYGHAQAGDLILIKGSQGSGENRIRMEEATIQLLAIPDLAPLCLVRQEEEWTKR